MSRFGMNLRMVLMVSVIFCGIFAIAIWQANAHVGAQIESSLRTTFPDFCKGSTITVKPFVNIGIPTEIAKSLLQPAHSFDVSCDPESRWIGDAFIVDWSACIVQSLPSYPNLETISEYQRYVGHPLQVCPQS